jgi:hypothetical protein
MDDGEDSLSHFRDSLGIPYTAKIRLIDTKIDAFSTAARPVGLNDSVYTPINQ